jgi:hypothetical protein
MNSELSKKLTMDYPKIFDVDNEFAKDPECYFGFECGDGWYWLIDHLCIYKGILIRISCLKLQLCR